MQKQNKEPLRLYLEYNENRKDGDPLEPDEPWTSYTDGNINVSFVRLHRKQPSDLFFYDSIELSNNKLFDLNKLFLAVVRYRDGGTFGSTNGYWHVVGLSPTYEIANIMLESAVNEPSTDFKPWEGYFASYQGVEIHELNVI